MEIAINNNKLNQQKIVLFSNTTDYNRHFVNTMLICNISGLWDLILGMISQQTNQNDGNLWKFVKKQINICRELLHLVIMQYTYAIFRYYLFIF